MARERFSVFDERASRDDPLFGPATKSERRHLKSSARSRDRELTAVYDEGRKEGRRQARAAHPSGLGRTLRATARPVRSGARRGWREVQAPVVDQVGSATKVAGMTFLVIALYLFLENATATAGALGAVARAVDWVKAPNKSVPYVKGLANV